MGRKIDVHAHLTFDSEGKRVTVAAEKDMMVFHFQGMSFVQVCRDIRVLDRLNVLDIFWTFAKTGGLRVYLKHGSRKFRMPGPAIWRALFRFLNFFDRR